MKNLPAPFYRDLINKLQELYILCEPVWDADGRLNDIRILDVNDACLERLKRPREKIIASTYSELLPPNNNTYSLLSELDAVARDGSEKRFELRFENPDVYFDIFACAPQPGQIVIL
ncbi:MAG: PAS domain-containing protein, partial [Anaerolineae bacterium]|nr:PAS domain-containing protein [Anaerolineae bacterium]